MSALFHTPLTAPRQFMGTVDATRERDTLCPRTLAEAFGDANAGGVIVPLPDTDGRFDKSERIVVYGSTAAAAALVVILIAERVAPWLFA